MGFLSIYGIYSYIVTRQNLLLQMFDNRIINIYYVICFRACCLISQYFNLVLRLLSCRFGFVFYLIDWFVLVSSYLYHQSNCSHNSNIDHDRILEIQPLQNIVPNKFLCGDAVYLRITHEINRFIIGESKSPSLWTLPFI